MTTTTFTILRIAILDGFIVPATWENVARIEGAQNTREFRTRLYTEVENDLRSTAIATSALYSAGHSTGLVGLS